ncbi:hypothetical protein [uncultured Bacteroides sp.]|jgi:hypothetical protein|uniref:hypothetical protein n=1 Tax=uncultured Bacteroides sp. TaxID=162156 RepID=UPI00280B504A|nr:hypothetical protein [uncultured Bacteroides sp.]
MIKKIALYLIAGIVTMLSACTDPDMGKSGGNTDLPDELTLQFNFTIPGNTVVNTRSIDPDGEPVSSIWLFLFNENGYYLGHVRANQVSYKKTNTSTDEGEGTFSAPSIPSTVRCIHFIANYNAADVDDSELLNRTEEEVMTRFTSSSGRLVYWGRKVFESEDELTSYFNNNSSSPIVLYRNQAAITYKIENNVSINFQGFAICNTYAKGTVAPYNHQNENNPFDFNLIESEEHTIHDFVTLCSGKDLIKATDPENTEIQNDWGLRYVFEHENALDDPMFAIFKIDGNYYKLMIVDSNSNPYKIIRNHRYIFNFHSAPPSTLGYATFEEAKNGVAANNVWVSIDNELPSIGDGSSSLTIEGETTRIYTEQKKEVINFTCKEITSDQVTATWLSNEGLASSDLNLQYDATTGKGSVTISLNEISDTPQYGTLQIKAGKYPRTIQIVYLNKFDFAPVWTSSSVPRRSGEPVSIVFNIPDTYPEELFPVECKISCNLFDANTNNQLEVIEEETAFTIDGQQVERDWDYKYVYKADKPGLHRVDFKTLIDDYNTSPEEELTWFLEAPYFNTIERTINMVDEAYANQKIIIYETTLEGNQASGTYERKIAPIKGQTFYLSFYLENGTPAGTKIRIYMDEAVEPGENENDPWPDNNLEAKTAPDAGRYFLYTVPEDASLDVNNRYLVSIPFHTVSAQCEGYARIAAASTDNNEEPEHCYKSAIVTRVNNPEAYNFSLKANDEEELSLPYGTGRNVQLSITPNWGNETVSSCEILIKTQNLEPADNNAAIIWDDEKDGYIWTITKLSAQTYTLDMLTKDVVSAETVSISEISGNVAFYEDEITIKNQNLTGTIKIDDNSYTFNTTSPFIALEKSDGTRIGAFTVEATTATTGTYTLTLRGEYDFTEDEELKVIYSPLDNTNIYVGTTTITALLKDSPELTLHLQQ